ncbi:phytoene desaturase family protein [Kribbella sp. CA-293567]|uniref:phytoene desaturase family protein n=1 Tax=Kribbella sp. CA-293567 TaxID=3002436 RepID=UPI0022DD4B2C|nr:phytoene desaturase family protein [Kribbella sp. CA-293567]WBQ08328.1 phytoene desaturase family protein [Kribbella sp. CA-293567]
MRTVAGRTDRVVVVGAGFAGLSAALHLAGRGRQVTVLEREPVPGGRAGRFDLDGYKFDTGPSVLTMPDLLEDAFAAVGGRLADHVQLTELDPAYSARFADGTSLAVHRHPEQMADAVREFAGAEAAAGYRRLRAWLETMYRVEFDRFVASNFDSPLSMLSPQLARLIALRGFGRLDPVIGRFIADERLRRVFTFQSLYVGQAPQQALALYSVITYMDTVAGVYFPRDGIRAIPDGLAAAATKAGVEFHYGSTVSELERTGQRVDAVRTENGDRYPCDAVVLTTELPVSYRLLGAAPRRLLPLRAAPSAVVLHAGSNREWPELAHHTISFGDAWRSTFTELIDEGSLMRDPSLLITRPSATDPLLAPPGHDVLSILAPVPNLQTGPRDWDRDGPRYAEQVVDLVEQRIAPGLAASLTATKLITPADWARQDMAAGTPFAWSHTFAQTGPFRPGNFPRRSDNVVLAGGGTVPGVGVPTAVISGRLAADRITGPALAHPARFRPPAGGTS